MSGGPVLLNVQEQLVVAGVVVGVDTVSYGGVEHSVGIAMVSDEIVSLRSERMGGILGDKLGLTAARLRLDSPPPDGSR
jgi:hypothetical protein